MPTNVKTSPSEDLQNEFDRFVEFGGLLDRQTRKYLVQYLKVKAGMRVELPPALEDAYYRYFTRALDEVFGRGELVELMQQRAGVREQILGDTLDWMRKAFRKAQRKNPFEEESSRLQQWSITPLARWLTSWHIPINYLNSQYRREQLDASYYEPRFKKLIGKRTLPELEQKDRAEIELLIKDLLASWDARLSARLLEFQLKKLDEEQESFQDRLQAKVEEFNKLVDLVNPFAEYTGRYWDMSRDLWEDKDFDVVQRYADLLQNEDQIRELADMLGRMREAEIEIEEEEFKRVIVRKQWLEDVHNKAEIDGVHESNDLSALLSSETSLLSDPDLETVFLQKFADANLLTLRYIDKQLVTSEHEFTEVDRRVKMKEKGPFIVCVDTSESMRGEPEQLAKVLCFAVLRMAARENRRAYLINFSVGIRTLDLFDVGRSLSALADFLRMSFRGGTDISLAMYEVLRQLRSESYRDADVLVVSDFIMYRVEQDIMEGVKHFQHNQGTQFHSLTLSEKPVEQIVQLFDTNWVYDPWKKGVVRDLAHNLKEMVAR